MKNLIKVIMPVFLGILLLFLIKTPSYAWTSADGEDYNTDSIHSPYGISKSLQGWLVYFIDDNQNTVSDVDILFQDVSIYGKFVSSKYQNHIKTRYGASASRRLYFSEWNANIGGSIVNPYNFDETSNADYMRDYMKTNASHIAEYLNVSESLREIKEEDKWFLVFEPIYCFPLYSPVENVPLERITGTTYSYSQFILNNILGTPNYPNGTLWGTRRDHSDGVLTSRGYWISCAYTNGAYGTFECIDDTTHTSKVGITTSGSSYFGINFSNNPLDFSVLADKSIGLGIIMASNSEIEMMDELPEIVQDEYFGKANVQCKTYNYSTSYNLSNLNNPKGRIPSGEILTNGIYVDKWFVDYVLKKHNLKRKVAVNYIYEWEEYDTHRTVVKDVLEEDLHFYENEYDFQIDLKKTVPPVPPATRPTYTYDVSYREKITRFAPNQTKYVERESFYYSIESYDVLSINKAEITCENTDHISAYSGNKVVYGANFPINFQYKKYTQDGHIVHAPQPRSFTIVGNSFSDCERIANSRLMDDADDWLVKNDLLKVTDDGRTTIFVNDGLRQRGIIPIELSTFDFPEVEQEKNVSIPYSCPNGFYYTSGEYTYKSNVFSGRGKLFHRNAPETHTAYLSTIEERIKDGYFQNEPVFIHTPVVTNITSGSRVDRLDKSYTEITVNDSGVTRLISTASENNKTQLIHPNDELVDYQLRLDNKYAFQFDIEKHLNLLGYSLNGQAKLYEKYVSSEKGAEVRFPFDIAIVKDDGGLEYHKANEWIRVDYMSETVYYIPSWAKETKNGQIFFRVFAYNYDGLDEGTKSAIYNDIDYYSSHSSYADMSHNIDADQNTPNQKYVSYDKISVQLSGYIYGLEITGCNDSIKLLTPEQVASATRDTKNEIIELARDYREIKSGTRNRLGGIKVKETNTKNHLGNEVHYVQNGWKYVWTLPYASNEQTNITSTLGKGTKIGFTINTISNMWNASDKVVITPSYRYISKDGSRVYSPSEFKLYYPYYEDDGSGCLVEMGSTKDLSIENIDSTFNTQIGSSVFVGTYSDDELTNTAIIYGRLHNKNKIPNDLRNYYGLTNVLYPNGDKGIPCYHLGLIEITERLKLFNGDKQWLSYNLDTDTSCVDVDLTAPSSFNEIKDKDSGEQIAYSTEELFEASMQKWYGEYCVPSNLKIVLNENLKGASDIYDYTDKYGAISLEDDELFQTDGYLVLNFDIKTIRDGEEDLTYYKNQNMLEIENSKSANHDTVYVGNQDRRVSTNPIPIKLTDGDVAIFDLIHNTANYYSVGIGWSN